MNVKLLLVLGLIVGVVLVGVVSLSGVGSSNEPAATEDPYADCSTSESRRGGDVIGLTVCEGGKPLPPEIEEKIKTQR
jgi:hypothetical protein